VSLEPERLRLAARRFCLLLSVLILSGTVAQPIQAALHHHAALVHLRTHARGPSRVRVTLSFLAAAIPSAAALLSPWLTTASKREIVRPCACAWITHPVQSRAPPLLGT
jgi:hypothetical protein